MKDENRKPTIDPKKPAQVVLNDFIKEKGILLGTQAGEIERTGKGSLIIHPPTIIAAYAEDMKKEKAK